MTAHPQKNTLLKATKANAATKAFKRVFFSPPGIKLFFKISHRTKKFLKRHRTVLTRTDSSLNVNRLEQSVCEYGHDSFGRTAAHAGNIKIKRNNFFEGFVRLAKCVLLINILQVQKMRTTLRCKLSFCLFAFFAETVSLLIPQKNYFVNPFFVSNHLHTTLRQIAVIIVLLSSRQFCSGQTTLCFSDNRESESGFIGQINGTKLFYEVWNVNAGQSMHYTSLLLRTDTIALDSIDFCFDMERQSDSIYVTITKSDTTIQFVTHETKNIPTLFQALIRAEYNFDQYYRFNDPNFGQKIFIKDNKLFLVYVHAPRFETTYSIVTKIYDLKNGQFKLSKTEEQKMQN